MLNRFYRVLPLLLALMLVVLPTVVSGQDEEPLAVFAAYSTPAEEPWINVIQAALTEAEAAGQITLEWVDELGYAGDMEVTLREAADSGEYDLIVGEAFGNEEAVRRVARDYPEIPFVFGSGLGPAEPNFSVFDNWIHEPAYLSGLIAGNLTESGTIGVVAGYPVPEVNRIVNAFITGVEEANPDAEVLVTFINSWFDPPTAKEAALAQVDAGADVLFAERFGVIEAAVENELPAFGMMSDQNELAPDTVVTGPVWNMSPTIQYIIEQVNSESYTAQDLKDFSMMSKGGAMLAPLHGFEETLEPELIQMVMDRQQEILDGLYRVSIDEASPAEAEFIQVE